MANNPFLQLRHDQPIVDPETGLPTQYFLEMLYGTVQNAEDTDVTAEAAAQLANAAQDTATAAQDAIDALVLNDLNDVDTVSTPPTDGQALLYDDGLGLWLPGTVSGGGGGGSFGFLGVVSVTGGATLDIPLPTGYVEHRIVLNLVPATAGVEIRGRVTTDGFTTVKNGASDYSYNESRAFPATGTTNTGVNNASYMLFDSNQSNVVAESMMGSLTIFGADFAGLPTEVQTKHGRANSGGAYNSAVGSGRYKTSELVNGLRLFASSGNVTGAAYVFGLVAA